MVATPILGVVLAEGNTECSGWMEALAKVRGQMADSYRRRADVRLGWVPGVVGYGLLLLTRVDKER